MSTTERQYTVSHDPHHGRFETTVDSQRCVCDYTLDGEVMNMTHTGVPPALEGRGIAAALVRAAFDHAEAEGLKIRPLCSYVAVWARRHPEVSPLLV